MNLLPPLVDFVFSVSETWIYFSTKHHAPFRRAYLLRYVSSLCSAMACPVKDCVFSSRPNSSNSLDIVIVFRSRPAPRRIDPPPAPVFAPPNNDRQKRPKRERKERKKKNSANKNKGSERRHARQVKIACCAYVWHLVTKRYNHFHYLCVRVKV